MAQNAQDGFQAAADIWSSWIFDDITVNIDIAFSALGAGILGSASSEKVTSTYSNFRSSIISDASSAEDATASANLPVGPSFDMLLNRTANHPNGAGSATAYLDNDGDANNTSTWLTRANAKALGLLSPTATASDAAITFSSNFSWDFDRSDGITGGAYDFVGVALHEIGHSLGFISGVDILDTNSSAPYFNDNQFTFVSPLDMFRFSAASYGSGVGVIDWTANAVEKYFSIDGGATSLGPTFSTGRIHGDGQQASHWKDNLGLGLLDPTASSGTVLNLSANDILGLDVVGYDLMGSASTVPEPGTMVLVVAGFCVLCQRRQALHRAEKLRG